MSAYKQAGITLNRAIAISSRTVRSALKPEVRAEAEKRAAPDIKVTKFENGVTKETYGLKQSL